MVGSAGAPAAQLEVALHRITRQEGGIVARSATDPAGRFRFSLPTGGEEEFPIYLVTARYRDILYFGPPLHGPPPDGSDYLVRVHETRPAEAFTAAGRTLTITADRGEGLRILDVLELANPTDSTLVPAAPAAPGWSLRLPEGAHEVTVVGAAEEPRLGRGGLIVEAPVPPGGRNLAVRYRLPGESVRLRVERPLPALELLVAEEARVGSTVGLEAESPVRLEEATYRRFTAVGLDSGSVVELRLAASAPRPWGWILLAVGMALAAAALLTARPPARPRLREAPPPP